MFCDCDNKKICRLADLRINYYKFGDLRFAAGTLQQFAAGMKTICAKTKSSDLIVKILKKYLSCYTKLLT
jgi:hypothetical protein